MEVMSRAFCTLLLGILLVACGSSGPATDPTSGSSSEAASVAKSSVYVPPGVDSTTAERADSLAGRSFVSLEKQRKASKRAEEGQSLVQISDSLWTYLEMGNDTTKIDSVSQEKKNEAIRAYNRGAGLLEKRSKLANTSELDSAEVRKMQADLLEKAKNAFEEAIRLNPYDDATRSRLAQIYTLQARRLQREDAYQKAIDVYEKLTRLRKDQPPLFLNLANNYFQTEQYEKAAENYRKARETYLESVELSLDTTRQADSSRVFEYARAEAESHRYARNADPALEGYRLAKTYAVNPEQTNVAQSGIEFVNWDDGNVDASFTRDSLEALVSQGEFAAAARGFRELKSQLRTQSAEDEIDWRLAQAEYQNGERDQAADRLQVLVKRTETGSDGAPVDSTYQRYFDTYGTICLNLGREKRDEDLRTALKYFQQSAEVPWERRGLAELEAGKLLRNNVEKSVEYLERAFQNREALEVEERLDLYRNLVKQHRRLRNRDEALRYRKMLRKLRKKTAAS